MSPTLTLYGYWRSSAVYRVRIALNLKALDYHYQPLHLLRDGGEQHGADYRALNPQQLIPCLLDGDRAIITVPAAADSAFQPTGLARVWIVE